MLIHQTLTGVNMKKTSIDNAIDDIESRLSRLTKALYLMTIERDLLSDHLVSLRAIKNSDFNNKRGQYETNRMLRSNL